MVACGTVVVLSLTEGAGLQVVEVAQERLFVGQTVDGKALLDVT
jgi:hypothetical protein